MSAFGTVMQVTLEKHELGWRIRMDGNVTVSSAQELKEMLLEWLAARMRLELDLDSAEEIDVTILQLLWAASREAAHAGIEIAIHASPAVLAAVHESGFDQMSGLGIRSSR